MGQEKDYSKNVPSWTGVQKVSLKHSLCESCERRGTSVYLFFMFAKVDQVDSKGYEFEIFC